MVLLGPALWSLLKIHDLGAWSQGSVYIWERDGWMGDNSGQRRRSNSEPLCRVSWFKTLVVRQGAPFKCLYIFICQLTCQLYSVFLDHKELLPAILCGIASSKATSRHPVCKCLWQSQSWQLDELLIAIKIHRINPASAKISLAHN